MKKACLRVLCWPHFRALIWALLILVLIFTGVLSILLYNHYPAYSAILASINAGCVTGIAFYLLANIRNREIYEENDEYETIEMYYKMAEETSSFCTQCVIWPERFQELFPQIKNNVNSLAFYMGTMFDSTPRVTKMIRKYPSDYYEEYVQVDSIIETASSQGKSFTSNEIAQILDFCSQTKTILFAPMIELMKRTDKLSHSIF